jgi:hypothetical protein
LVSVKLAKVEAPIIQKIMAWDTGVSLNPEPSIAYLSKLEMLWKSADSTFRFCYMMNAQKQLQQLAPYMKQKGMLDGVDSWKIVCSEPGGIGGTWTS